MHFGMGACIMILLRRSLLGLLLRRDGRMGCTCGSLLNVAGALEIAGAMIGMGRTYCMSSPLVQCKHRLGKHTRGLVFLLQIGDLEILRKELPSAGIICDSRLRKNFTFRETLYLIWSTLMLASLLCDYDWRTLGY